MSYDKVVDSTTLDSGLTSIANAIRQKFGISGELEFPNGMTEMILNAEDSLEGRLQNTMTEYSNSNVTQIPNYGFAGQSGLRTVSLPNLRKIGEHGFLNATRLHDLNFPMLVTISYNSFRSCVSLQEFVTNSNFNSRIDISTFEGCNGLKKIDLFHITTQGIGNFALSCKNLQTLIIRNTDFVPSVQTRSFGDFASQLEAGKGYIYVPASMVELYKAATNWSTHADQIRAIEDYPEITGG